MTLRGRITLSMLSVVAISGGVATFTGGYLLRRHLEQQAENRVRQDLSTASAFYRQRLEAMQAALRYTALGERFSQAVTEKDVSYLSLRLGAVRRSEGLDLLCVTDPRGRVTHRAHRPGVSGDPLADDHLVGRVLKGEETVSGTMLVPVETLQAEDPLLAERASIRMLPTPMARPTDASQLAAGMMLCCAAGVRGPDGKLAGVLRAGILLNRNYDLVDQVRDTVFRDERYRGKLIGTATVFQHDVRISTNVLRDDGSRAIGSRVSEEVYDHVLRQGETWVGSAWVVNDWYISAYAPIDDIDGNPVGMLYVGVLERKFLDVTVRTLTVFGLVTLAGLVAAGLAAWKLTDSICRPVRSLASAAASIAEGDFSRTLPVGAADAIGSLTQTFNRMARSLKERDELLKERTRLQLTRSERLASIGRLAAGVAHEINNPLTGVVTFAHMLLEGAPEGSQERKDIETIIAAAMRCRDIVRGLLDFSRQNEPRKSLADLNRVLAQALTLTRNQAMIHGVHITEEMDRSLPHLVIDASQIQDVAVNVLVNAIDAMSDGGDLVVRTRAVDRNGTEWAELEIADTGCGIAPEHLEHVFDPFFTTKQTGKGTGLGLAVSYGIVSEHGGQIDVSSEVGRGTTVAVRLPITPKELPDEQESTDPGC